jgi:demethylmenaquinone methyltransferase/2-methoxy-6-polyprenyl-1,4-benzoquinol methylase
MPLRVHFVAMSKRPDELDKTAQTIQEMFAAVAPRYDLLNHLLSGFLDNYWRRQAAEALDVPSGDRVLDICCGTGDQALQLTKRGLRVTAADFCLPMLALAKHKYARLMRSAPAGLAGDSLLLPFPDASFRGITVAFGLRNVADLDQALAEMARVVGPAGRVAILEFSIPQQPILKSLYLFYFFRILPLIGKLISSHKGAYAYLPNSVTDFPQRGDMVDRMTAQSINDGNWTELSGGTVCLYTGTCRKME